MSDSVAKGKAIARTALILGLLASVGVAHAHKPVTTTVLFNREIATLFNAKCVQCHGSGGMGITLETYAQVRAWAESIKQELVARRMPPWSADGGYGEFRNAHALTARELSFVLSWIDGGMPEGEGSPPVAMDHREHWMLGRPDDEYDAVLDRSASSAVDWRRYWVDLEVPAGKGIRALDLQMPDAMTRAAFLSLGKTGDYLGGWTPLGTSIEYPTGAALSVKNGNRIVIDALQPGHAGNSMPRLAVYWTDESANTVTGLKLTEFSVDGAASRLEYELKSELQLVGLRVDPGVAGSSLEFFARGPNGEMKPLLAIRQYDPSWPVPFVLKRPVTLVAGTMLYAIVRNPKALAPAKATIDLTVATGVIKTDQSSPPSHEHHH